VSAPFEANLFKAAERFLLGANEEERQEVARIIDSVLCYDPYIDLHCKIRFDVPPVVVSMYQDERFWIVYHIVKNTQIDIWNIGRAHERRAPY